MVTVVISAQAGAQTMDHAVHAALSAHPGMEAARNILEATRETRREARAAYFPDVSAGLAAGRIYGDNATSRGLSVTRGAGYSYYGEGSIGLNQMIFDGLETLNRVEAATSRSQAAHADMDDLREGLSLRAAQSYVDVLRTRRALGMLDDHAQKLDDYLARIADMVEQGASDEVELQQARDVGVILKAIRAEYDAQASAAEARYTEITGLAVPSALADPPDMASNMPRDLAASIETVRNTHPALISARHQASAASYDIKAEQGTLYPDLSGELSYLKSDKDDVLGGEIIDGRALLRMNWNFSTGGEQMARIRRSKYNHHERQARVAELERQIEQNIKLAYSEYANARQQLAYLDERRALNETLFSAYETQFEGARVSLLQLMQAHNQLFNTHLELNNGYYRYLAAQYGVLANMGALQHAMAQ